MPSCLIEFIVIPLPAWKTLPWNNLTTDSEITESFGRIRGCFSENDRLECLKRPPTRITPFSSKNGFKADKLQDHD